MTDIFTFILVLFVFIKTVFYGVWTFSYKRNIAGGIFICLLSLSSALLGAYVLFGNA